MVFPLSEFCDFTFGYKKDSSNFSKPNLIWNIAAQHEERMKTAGKGEYIFDFYTKYQGGLPRVGPRRVFDY